MKAKSLKGVITISVITTTLILCACTNTEQQDEKEITFENTDKVKNEELIINGESKGRVKVSLEEIGYEHIHTPLIIQWLDNDSIVTNELTLNDGAPDVWSLSINSLEKNPEGLLLDLSGTHSYSYEDKDFQIQIEEKGVSGDLFN